MPTLTAASSAHNIQKSVKAFVDAQIATGLGHTLWFEGMGRVGSLPAQWVEVDTAELSPQSATMSTGTGKRGVIAQYLIGVNCFIHKDAIRAGSFDIYALSEMAKNVKQLFLPPASIPILDFDTIGNPQVGSLISQTVPDVVDVPTPSQAFYQKNIGCRMNFISEWTTA